MPNREKKYKSFTKYAILLYSDLFDVIHRVIYLETSQESGNHLVRHGEREIWLRPSQVKETGEYHLPGGPVETVQKKQSWKVGDEAPAHLYKQKGVRKWG